MPQPKKYENAAARTAAWRQRTAQPKPAPAHYSQLKPGYRRWELMAASAMDIIDTILQEMEEYRDERSEAWAESEKAEVFTQNMDALTEARDALEQLDA